MANQAIVSIEQVKTQFISEYKRLREGAPRGMPNPRWLVEEGRKETQSEALFWKETAKYVGQIMGDYGCDLDKAAQACAMATIGIDVQQAYIVAGMMNQCKELLKYIDKLTKRMQTTYHQIDTSGACATALMLASTVGEQATHSLRDVHQAVYALTLLQIGKPAVEWIGRKTESAV